MPTYEYVCTACGHRLESVQSFSDPALTTCPVCQGALRKVFGNVGIVLKGSGFYKNDSRSAGRSNGSATGPKEPKEKESTVSSETGSKETGSKETGSKETGSKESGAKDSGSTSSPPSSGSSEKAAATSN
jgi:putative FmdB family regulatory protein